MIAAFYDWVKNISFYLILVTMITYLMPNAKYKKYLKFFTGVLLVVLVIQPFVNLTNRKDILNRAFLVEGLKEEINSIKRETQVIQNVQNDAIKQGYEEEIERQIGEIASKQNLYIQSVEVKWLVDAKGAFVGIDALNVIVSTKEDAQNGIIIQDILIGKEEEIESMEEINLKNDIQEVYNILSDNINISIQR
jgi:Stage III sporulation protein AF (Spore_III_AF).